MKKNEKNLKNESKHSQTSKNTKNLSKKVLCIIVLIVLLFLIIFFKDNFVNLIQKYLLHQQLLLTLNQIILQMLVHLLNQ